MTKVELEPAHRWQCPKCEAWNFAECVIAEIPPDEKQELVIKLGGFDVNGFQGDFLTAPSYVTCLECFEEFETELGDDE